MTITAEQRAKIVAYKTSGRSVRDIAGELGVSKSTVSLIIKQVSEPVAESPAEEKSVAPEESISMSVSEVDTESFLKAIEPPPVVVQPPASDSEQKAFIRKLAMNINRKKEEPVQEEDEEVVAPKRQAKSVKFKDVPAPAAAAAAPAVKAPEMDKGTLIAKISSLVLTFAPILTSHVKDPARFIEQLPGRSVSDLKTTLELLEATKSIHNGASGMFHMFGMVAGAVELMGSKVHLQTSGYQAAIMSQSDELKRIFQEIAYNNLDSFKRIQGPEARLALLMTQTLLAIDSRNRTLKNGPEQPVAEETQVRFSDL